eukprot:GHVU01071570.1.p1 GENE.GHVU01071570.1~~GHVU01071570.1.p1  ORF type:complete len:153 (-),score=12.33 GHVU01071570.1:121-579(-)
MEAEAGLHSACPVALIVASTPPPPQPTLRRSNPKDGLLLDSCTAWRLYPPHTHIHAPPSSSPHPSSPSREAAIGDSRYEGKTRRPACAPPLRPAPSLPPSESKPIGLLRLHAYGFASPNPHLPARQRERKRRRETREKKQDSCCRRGKAIPD